VAERKNVSGINRAFAVTTDQSCLNRWLTQVDWDVTKLNERRLEVSRTTAGRAGRPGAVFRSTIRSLTTMAS
jgi:hypothetical protein